MQMVDDEYLVDHRWIVTMSRDHHLDDRLTM